jgi:hypothetical protein
MYLGQGVQCVCALWGSPTQSAGNIKKRARGATHKSEVSPNIVRVAEVVVVDKAAAEMPVLVVVHFLHKLGSSLRLGRQDIGLFVIHSLVVDGGLELLDGLRRALQNLGLHALSIDLDEAASEDSR